MSVRDTVKSVSQLADKTPMQTPEEGIDPLSFSFRCLLAALILFLECDTLLFGTASRIGGRSSMREAGLWKSVCRPFWSAAMNGLDVDDDDAPQPALSASAMLLSDT